MWPLPFFPMAHAPTAHASPAYPACDISPAGSVARISCESACAQNPNGAVVCANYGAKLPPPPGRVPADCVKYEGPDAQGSDQDGLFHMCLTSHGLTGAP